jgi:hypothetical protein
MIFDSTNKFSSSQALTVTAASENVIDLGVTNRDIGNGEVIPVYIEVDVALEGLTSLQVAIQTDDAEGFGSAVTVVSSGAILAADLIAGYQFAVVHVPLHVLGRYMRLNYVVVGTATAGSVVAGITMGNQQNG